MQPLPCPPGLAQAAVDKRAFYAALAVVALFVVVGLAAWTAATLHGVRNAPQPLLGFRRRKWRRGRVAVLPRPLTGRTWVAWSPVVDVLHGFLTPAEVAAGVGAPVARAADAVGMPPGHMALAGSAPDARVAVHLVVAWRPGVKVAFPALGADVGVPPGDALLWHAMDALGRADVRVRGAAVQAPDPSAFVHLVFLDMAPQRAG